MKQENKFRISLVLLTLAVIPGLSFAGNNLGKFPVPQTTVGQQNPNIQIRRGVPQMRLGLKDIKVNNRSAIRQGVSIGDSVTAALTIRNYGTAPGKVKVGYIIGLRRAPQVTSSGYVNIVPGQVVTMLLNVRIRKPSFDKNIHSLRGADGLYWSPTFALLTTSNTLYRDSRMADNQLRGGALANIPVHSKTDLAVVSIGAVTLTETWQGGDQWDRGVTRPISLQTIVKVKNNATQTSQPTNMVVTVLGKQSAHVDFERARGVTRHLVGRCAYWPICTMKQDISIAAIPAGQTVAFRVRFTNIPHRIVSKKHKASVALGPYICGRHPARVVAGHARISISLQNAAINEARPLRKDNYLTQQGRFTEGVQTRTQVTCGFERSSVRNKRP